MASDQLNFFNLEEDLNPEDFDLPQFSTDFDNHMEQANTLFELDTLHHTAHCESLPPLPTPKRLRTSSPQLRGGDDESISDEIFSGLSSIPESEGVAEEQQQQQQQQEQEQDENESCVSLFGDLERMATELEDILQRKNKTTASTASSSSSSPPSSLNPTSPSSSSSSSLSAMKQRLIDVYFEGLPDICFAKRGINLTRSTANNNNNNNNNNKTCTGKGRGGEGGEGGEDQKPVSLCIVDAESREPIADPLVHLGAVRLEAKFTSVNEDKTPLDSEQGSLQSYGTLYITQGVTDITPHFQFAQSSHGSEVRVKVSLTVIKHKGDDGAECREREFFSHPLRVMCPRSSTNKPKTPPPTQTTPINSRTKKRSSSFARRAV